MHGLIYARYFRISTYHTHKIKLASHKKDYHCGEPKISLSYNNLDASLRMQHFCIHMK